MKRLPAAFIVLVFATVLATGVPLAAFADDAPPAGHAADASIQVAPTATPAQVAPTQAAPTQAAPTATPTQVAPTAASKQAAAAQAAPTATPTQAAAAPTQATLTQGGNTPLATQVEPDPASGTAGGCTWTLDSDGTLTIAKSPDGDGVFSGTFSDEGASVWNGHRTDEDATAGHAVIRSVVFGEGTSVGESMAWMFSRCTELESVDMSKLDTSKVKRIDGLFSLCGNLREFDTATITSRQLETMSSAFLSCTQLKALDFSAENWAASDLVDLHDAFAGCTNLVELYLDGLAIGADANVGNMFGYCVNLAYFTIGDGVKALGTPPTKDTTRWYSNFTYQWFTSAEIAATRLGTFDFYSKNPIAINKASVTIPDQTYTGRALTPVPTVVLEGTTLRYGIDFTVSYRNNIGPGTAYADITATGAYDGFITKAFTIKAAPKPQTSTAPAAPSGGSTGGSAGGPAGSSTGGSAATPSGKASETARPQKKANTLTVKAKTIAVKKSALKRNVSFAKGKAFKVSKAQGKVTFKVISYDKKAKKKITVSKAGKLTVKKGLKAGTYKLKVRVSAAGNASYQAGSKTVTAKVKVK